MLIPVLMIAAMTEVTAQNVAGTVFDQRTNEPLPGVNVLVDGTVTGTATRADGRFQLNVNFAGGPVTLVVSFVGYTTTRIQVDGPTSDLRIGLTESRVMGDDIVVSATRREERIMESPVTIQRVDSRQIQNISSPDLYSGLQHLQGIDLNSSSMLFTTINTRGFNSAKPERTIQLADYADTQIPSLNFSASNLNGIPEIDIESVEIIHGPASALYGANAFNGVVNVISKDPFLYPGITAQARYGEREMYDFSIRIADTFACDRMAYKIVGQYFEANDWMATSMDPQFTSLYGPNDPRGYDAVNMYGDIAINFAQIFAGTPNEMLGQAIGTVYMNGFTEQELLRDNKAKNLKLVGNLQYLITDRLKASYEYKFAQGAATYQSTSRYRFDDFRLQTHKLELTGENFVVRGYTIEDDSGDTYDLTFLGAFLNREAASLFVPAYAQAFAAVFLAGGTPAEAHAAARDATRDIRFNVNAPKGSPAASRVEAVRSNADASVGGAGFDVNSRINHVEGQYNYDFNDIELTFGGSYRQFRLNSNGSLFDDEGGVIENSEFGLYLQAGTKLMDDRLALLAAVRYDDFKNFDGNISPRVSAVYTVGDNRQHNFRASFQTAFRSPTQLDQYIMLDIGQIILLGNIGDGFNGFTIPSVQAGNPQPISIAPLKVEQVKTVELGYKGILMPDLYLDATFYMSWYDDFIGAIRFINQADFRPTQVWTNANESVSTMGFSLGLNYYLRREANFMASYTYASLDDSNLNDPIIPAFNTPEHKYSIGVSGEPIANLTYSLNYKWVQEHRYEMPFAEGNVPDYFTLDGHIAYNFVDWNSTLKVAGQNLTNNRHIQTYGAPTIGRLVFAALTVNF